MILSLATLPIAQLSGAWGLAGSLAWSFARSRNRMLAVQLATQPGFVLYWALSGDAPAASASFLLWVLGFLAAGLGSGNAGRQRLLRCTYLVALVPAAVSTLLAWNGAASAFALLGMVICCYARWQTDPVRFRDLLLGSSVPWLAHDLLMGSVPATCADLLCLARAIALHLPGRPSRIA